MGYKYQNLKSYKLRFNFSSDAGILEYLNKKEFKTPRKANNLAFRGIFSIILHLFL